MLNRDRREREKKQASRFIMVHVDGVRPACAEWSLQSMVLLKSQGRRQENQSREDVPSSAKRKS
jgi:hypothetical protein